MAAHIVSETASVPCKRARSSSDASSNVISSGESSNQSLSDTPSFPVHSTTLPPMKRRVNPDSLASRLAPELVREMDAFIMSGNMEMPSFAVRKELQERYNIDRRHIYDYFHSKGMRVIKDDKVSNLVRRTDRPTKVLSSSRDFHASSLLSRLPKRLCTQYDKSGLVKASWMILNMIRLFLSSSRTRCLWLRSQPGNGLRPF